MRVRVCAHRAGGVPRMECCRAARVWAAALRRRAAVLLRVRGCGVAVAAEVVACGGRLLGVVHTMASIVALCWHCAVAMWRCDLA